MNTDNVPFLDNQITIAVAPVDAHGNVKLRLPQNAHFVSEVPGKVGNDVLLIRLTDTDFSDMKSGIFLPEK